MSPRPDRGSEGGNAPSSETESVIDSVPEMRWRDLAFEDYITLFLFWLLALVVFAQVASRFLLSSPLGWTEEMSRFMLIYVGFLGATIAVRKNTHIYIELVYHFLPTRAAKFLAGLVDLLRTVFLVIATFLAWQVTSQMGGQRMSVMPFPMSYVYGVVMVAFAMMSVRSIQFAWKNWREGYEMVNRLHVPSKGGI